MSGKAHSCAAQIGYSNWCDKYEMEDVAEDCCGAPSLSMLLESYNKKHTGEHYYEFLEVTEGGLLHYENVESSGMNMEKFSIEDDLYFHGENYWLCTNVPANDLRYVYMVYDDLGTRFVEMAVMWLGRQVR